MYIINAAIRIFIRIASQAPESVISNTDVKSYAMIMGIQMATPTFDLYICIVSVLFFNLILLRLAIFSLANTV